MSLEPHWYSTIYGLLFIVGQGLNALAFAIVLTTYFSEAPPFSHYLTEKHFHDLGKLTHGFVVFWAYGTFAQYLIIWCGNLPEEIPWYLHRTSHGWGIVAIALMVFHFFVPFFLLLSRTNKRRKNVLLKISLAIIVMRFIDLYWMIIPSFPNNGLYIHWLYIVTPIALGGIWLAVFFSQLKARSLAPLPDPFTETEQALEHA
jgi:hypothetical protein